MSEQTIHRRVVITNGNCPAGRACAELLRHEGVQVLTGYAPGETTGDPDCTFLLDWAKAGASEEATASAIQRLGGIDVLVCTFPEFPRTLLTDTTAEALDRFFLGQYRSALMTVKAAALSMTEQKSGAIVLMTGAEGLRAKKNDYLCGSFFAGLHRSMQTFALQLAPYGIRINAVCSGEMEGTNPTVAERLPFGRLGRWEEAAKVMRFLVSEDASYLTGTVIPCDGGYSLAGMPENGFGYGWDTEQCYVEYPEESGKKEGV